MSLAEHCHIPADRVPDMDPHLTDALCREVNKRLDARERAAKQRR